MNFYLLLIWIEFKFRLKNKNTIRLNRLKADTRTSTILFENDTARRLCASIILYIRSTYVWSIHFSVLSIVKLVASTIKLIQQRIRFE